MSARLTLHDYEVSKWLAGQDVPFYALVATAIRQADSDNALRLSVAFPQIAADLQARYNAPGGFLPGEEQCTGSCHDADRDDCVRCGSGTYALACADCRSYMAEDAR